MLKATIVACSNLALVKYWGKTNKDLNIPANDSISVSLDKLNSTTTVEFSDDYQDTFILNDKRVTGEGRQRIEKVVNKFREITDLNKPTKISSVNNFPTAAGIASSASGFGALGHALYEASRIEYTKKDVSKLARMGSGSAARTVHAGFAHWKAGSNYHDSYATQVLEPNDLQIIVAITSGTEKKISSSKAMDLSEISSPFFDQRAKTANKHVSELKEAMETWDFPTIGSIAQKEANNLHAVINTTKLGVYYWNDTTMRVINCILELQEEGIDAYYTIDAGPQVKILCMPDTVNIVIQRLNDISGIEEIIQSGVGFGSKSTNEHLF